MSESDEYITPKKYVSAARKLMRGIDLDPATTKRANEQVIKARHFWTKGDDFLSKGNLSDYKSVWLNPPYSNAKPFVHKVLENWQKGHIKQATILIHVCPANRWFQKMWSCPICFVSPRISFLKDTGKNLVAQTDNRYDNKFIYLPKNQKSVLKFQEIFCKFGKVTNLFEWLQKEQLEEAKQNARMD